jgi:hypothetical protein
MENSYNLLVKGVDLYTLKKYVEWLESKRWGYGIGYVLFHDTTNKGKYLVDIDSGTFSSLWSREIKEEVIEFWNDHEILGSIEEELEEL